VRNRLQRTLISALLVTLLAGLAGCDSDESESVFVSRTSIPTVAATSSAAPTPASTRTPTPSATATAAPSATATGSPGATPTPAATSTLTPTPTPTVTPRSTATPAQSATPAATPTLAPSACIPSGALGVLLSGANVDAYDPNSAWGGAPSGATGVKGVQLVPIEGTDARATISTPNEVNSCSGNSATGTTVCTANNTDVYIINGSKLTATLTSGATRLAAFSGGAGFCENCGVVIDSTSNTAFLGIGLAGDRNQTGYQTLDLTSNTFGVPIPSGTGISEGFAVDPIRHLILSPNEQNSYELVRTRPSTAVFENSFHPFEFFDSAAEDCTTGITLAASEATSQLLIADLTQATFTPGSPGTWTAPSRIQNFPGFDFLNGGAGEAAVAVAPGSHLGIVTGEPTGPGYPIGVIQLPSTSGSGRPAVEDFVAARLPFRGTGGPGSAGIEPHAVTAYVSPTSNKAFGLVAGDLVPRGDIAVVDLQGMLKAPRTPATHTVDPSFDLLKSGVVRLVSTF
jgi:hypothetical protein